MPFDLTRSIDVLRRTPSVVTALLDGIDDSWSRATEGPDTFSPFGIACLRQFHDAGAATIAQDEETSTVFGMPKAAIELGAADRVLAIDDVAAAICELVASAPSA